MLTYIGNHNVIQVAAAGNDSADLSRPQPMRLPASHQDVIGVTSVRPGLRRIVCYANRGEFGAWGGGVVTASGRCDTENLVENCTGDHDACITGWNPNSLTLADRGVGTSFAAPVVAGMAAQIIDRRTPPPPQVVNNSIATSVQLTPAQIRHELRAVAQSQCASGEEESVLIDLADCAVYLPTVVK
jgi:subtilisin family serine protease